MLLLVHIIEQFNNRESPYKHPVDYLVKGTAVKTAFFREVFWHPTQ